MIGALGCCLALLLALASNAGALTRAERSPTRPVNGDDMAALRGYTDQVGKTWLKQSLGLDLDALAVEWDPRQFRFSRPSFVQSKGAGATGTATGGGMAARPGAYFDLRLEQTDDLRRLQEGFQDLPFGLSISGQLPFLASLRPLETKLWLPLSGHEELRAQATWPYQLLNGRLLTLRSDYRNFWGLNHLEAGLGTNLDADMLGIWNVDYDFQQRFGQGANEEIHWLKFSRRF